MTVPARSLRSKLTTAFIGLALGPLLLAGVVIAGRGVVAQYRQAHALEAHVAATLRIEAAGYIEGLVRELTLMVRVKGLPDRSPAEQRAALEALLSDQPMFAELAYLDRDGRERVRLSMVEVVTDGDLRSHADHPEFTGPKASAAPWFGPVAFDPATNEPRMTVSVPVIDPRGGGVTDVLTASIRLKRIWHLVATAATGRDDVVYMLDRDGWVVAHRNPSVVLRGTRIDLPATDRIRRGIGGDWVVMARSGMSLGDQAFTVVAERPVAAAMAATVETVATLLVAMAGALAVAAALLLRARRSMLTPILRLADVSRRIQDGDLSITAEVTSHDEVGELALAFNRMTARLRLSLRHLETRIAERRQVEEELERRVEERTRALTAEIAERQTIEQALRAATERAEAAAQAKSDFLAKMSHELRTPLNAIIGFSDIMRSGMFGMIENSRYRTYNEDIYRSGLHLLDLTNDILDLSKVEAGCMEIERTPVPVDAIVDAALTMVRERAADGGLSLEVRLAPDLPLILGDARRLRQILLNLLANAVKFTPAGGRVTVTARRCDQDALILSVADTGIGIAAEDIPKVMEVFGQVSHAQSDRHPGTGLGLPLARQLTELHGGTLHLDSEPGQGTVVTLRFPPACLAVVNRAIAAQ